VAAPSFTDAFHKSPSKLKITICPSGVSDGLDRKNGSAICAVLFLANKIKIKAINLSSV
jgi:hypothetical protein